MARKFLEDEEEEDENSGEEKGGDDNSVVNRTAKQAGWQEVLATSLLQIFVFLFDNKFKMKLKFL